MPLPLQRPAYSPGDFLNASLPPWFTAGRQQDCSEYLKYLLDQLHEQASCNKPSGQSVVVVVVILVIVVVDTRHPPPLTPAKSRSWMAARTISTLPQHPCSFKPRARRAVSGSGLSESWGRHCDCIIIVDAEEEHPTLPSRIPMLSLHTPCRDNWQTWLPRCMIQCSSPSAAPCGKNKNWPKWQLPLWPVLHLVAHIGTNQHGCSNMRLQRYPDNACFFWTEEKPPKALMAIDFDQK